MTINEVIAMLVWSGASAVLLVIIMIVDSLFTRYKDLVEIKKGNVAVTTRFVMKLLAQAYILSQSITTSNHLGEALVVSIISFLILLLLEGILRILLRLTIGLNLDKGTQEGQIAHALFAGSIHVAGALVIGSCL
ncbi:DUF350 domain-containing protein [Paenibacillus baekrokdamisoli]|uniref:DUF350 domain-containing protein n=1 Tax=Paenibacillus baekrokdamisoli TaxID=1712516 RepID=A0A3G9IMM5_9BACL|nr:DUF350 domain-containing protein [Paenibacillus baekrokdamisoli]MBB3067265.1 uncharacterized membrane protein YjfL (UPF0719 family) [Paenibacillus baekrokdamisoli]BBH19546.1 DUF350 domain-containing protein [Paenibacillus baekrokdamisoli]